MSTSLFVRPHGRPEANFCGAALLEKVDDNFLED